jgi:hypothetical protein
VIIESIHTGWRLIGLPESGEMCEYDSRAGIVNSELEAS